MRHIRVFQHMPLSCIPGCSDKGSTHISAISEAGQKGDIVLSLCPVHRRELLDQLLCEDRRNRGPYKHMTDDEFEVLLANLRKRK